MNTSFNEWLKIHERWDVIAPKHPDAHTGLWDDDNAWEDEERRLRTGQELVGKRIPVRDLGTTRGRTLRQRLHLPRGMHIVKPHKERLQNLRQHPDAEYLALRNKVHTKTATPEEAALFWELLKYKKKIQQ